MDPTVSVLIELKLSCAAMEEFEKLDDDMPDFLRSSASCRRSSNPCLRDGTLCTARMVHGTPVNPAQQSVAFKRAGGVTPRYYCTPRDRENGTLVAGTEHSILFIVFCALLGRRECSARQVARAQQQLRFASTSSRERVTTVLNGDTIYVQGSEETGGYKTLHHIVKRTRIEETRRRDFRDACRWK